MQRVPPMSTLIHVHWTVWDIPTTILNFTTHLHPHVSLAAYLSQLIPPISSRLPRYHDTGNFFICVSYIFFFKAVKRRERLIKGRSNKYRHQLTTGDLCEDGNIALLRSKPWKDYNAHFAPSCTFLASFLSRWWYLRSNISDQIYRSRHSGHSYTLPQTISEFIQASANVSPFFPNETYCNRISE